MSAGAGTGEAKLLMLNTSRAAVTLALDMIPYNNFFLPNLLQNVEFQVLPEGYVSESEFHGGNAVCLESIGSQLFPHEWFQFILGQSE